MTIRVIAARASSSAARSGSRFGVWIAALMSGLTAVTLAMAVTTPPRSGPFCRAGCVGYPYTDIAAFFPRDYLWMYPALLIAPLLVACMAAIHAFAAQERKIFSLIGLTFASMAATLLTIDYFIQLTVIQPSLLRGEGAGLTMLSQYNPHGLFIALEAAGYLLMGIAFAGAAAVFAGRDRLERALRWIFGGGFALAAGGFVALWLIYGHDLDYRFEVFVILVDWLVLIVAGALLSVVFGRAGHAREDADGNH